MQLTDLKPDRLTRAKFKIRDLINSTADPAETLRDGGFKGGESRFSPFVQAKASLLRSIQTEKEFPRSSAGTPVNSAQNTQMGLVVFTGEAFVASPLSQDANTLNGMLDELHPQMMPISGSDMGQGLSQGLALLKQGGVTHGNLLLITASDPTADSWTEAQNIAQAGSHLQVLAMLEPNQTTQSTITKLQELAKLGNGSFYLFTPDSTDIQNILRNNNKKQAIKDEKVENAYLWQDAGPWFCLLLIPFALVVLREKARHEKHH